MLRNSLCDDDGVVVGSSDIMIVSIKPIARERVTICREFNALVNV